MGMNACAKKHRARGEKKINAKTWKKWVHEREWEKINYFHFALIENIERESTVD